MYPSYEAFCFGPFLDKLGSTELSGFDEVNVVAEVLSSLAVSAVDLSSDDDEVRKLILFGSNGLGCTVKLCTVSALVL